MRAVGIGGLLLFAACDQAFDLVLVGPPADAVPDARVCAAGAPFSPGAPVRIDGAYSVEAARFSDDRSTAYLALCPASGATVGCDLYSSKLSANSAELTEHDKLGGVSSIDAYDSYPTVTRDGDHILFASDRGGSLQIWLATKDNGSFENPVLTQLALITGGQFTHEPYLLADGQTLYFSGGLDASDKDWDLYRTSGAAPGFGGPGVPVDGTVTTADEQAPVVSADELEVFFSSNRAAGTGQLDIYAAVRTSSDLPFAPPVALAGLSTPGGNDWPVWLAPDGCELYYINRPGSVSTLYVATR